MEHKIKNVSNIDREPPSVIWLQWYGTGGPLDGPPVSTDDVTWSEEMVWPGDAEYMRADRARNLEHELTEYRRLGTVTELRAMLGFA
jgi:hypothetical protein